MNGGVLFPLVLGALPGNKTGNGPAEDAEETAKEESDGESGGLESGTEGAAGGEEPIRTRSGSRHGKELMASHEIPPHVPPARTWKPLIAAMLLVVTAAGGFIFSGVLVAAPQSPWVTGETGKVLGSVKAKEGDFLPNATVAVGDIETITDQEGKFTLDNIPTGRQVILVEAPGYKQLRFITYIGGGSPMWVPLAVTPGNGTETVDDYPAQAQGFYVCGTLSLVFSAITLLGALFAYQRRRFPIATSGAIIGIGILPLFPVGTVLCLVSIVLLLFSRGEFS